MQVLKQLCPSQRKINTLGARADCSSGGGLTVPPFGKHGRGTSRVLVARQNVAESDY